MLTGTENCFRRMLASTNCSLSQGEGISDAIAVSLLSPQELNEHMLDTTLNDNHVFKLI